MAEWPWLKGRGPAGRWLEEGRRKQHHHTLQRLVHHLSPLTTHSPAKIFIPTVPSCPASHHSPPLSLFLSPALLLYLITRTDSLFTNLPRIGAESGQVTSSLRTRAMEHLGQPLELIFHASNRTFLGCSLLIKSLSLTDALKLHQSR